MYFAIKTRNLVRQVVSAMMTPLLILSMTPGVLALPAASSVKAPIVATNVPKAMPAHIKTGSHKVEIIKPTLNFSTSPSDLEITTARVFAEPLAPMGGKQDSQENAALAKALLQFRSSKDSDQSVLSRYITVGGGLDPRHSGGESSGYVQ